MPISPIFANQQEILRITQQEVLRKLSRISSAGSFEKTHFDDFVRDDFWIGKYEYDSNHGQDDSNRDGDIDTFT